MAKITKRKTLYIKPQANLSSDIQVSALQGVDAVRSQEVKFAEVDSRVTEKSNFGGGFDMEAPQSGGAMGEVQFKVEAQSAGPTTLPEHELLLRAAGFVASDRAAVAAAQGRAAVAAAKVYKPSSNPSDYGRLAVFCDGDKFVSSIQKGLASAFTIEGTVGENLMFGTTIKGNIKQNSNFTGTLPNAVYKTRDPILVVGGRCVISEHGATAETQFIRPKMESFSIDLGLSFANVPDLNDDEGFAEGYNTACAPKITFTSLFDGATDYYDKFRKNTDYTITFAFEGGGAASGQNARGSIWIIFPKCRMDAPAGYEEMNGLDARSFTFGAYGTGAARDDHMQIEFRGPLPTQRV